MSRGQRLAATAGLLTLVACAGEPPADGPERIDRQASSRTVVSGLLPLPVLDPAGLAPEVAGQLAEQDGKVRRALAADDDDLALAALFGDLGRLYHAYDLFEPAAACYRNAAQLAPTEARWPYLLAVLAQRRGEADAAAELLRRSLALAPDHGAARLRLARLELDRQRLVEADGLFAEVLIDRPTSAYALEGRGLVAVERGELGAAVEWFRRALELQPAASRLHYSLALAYRGHGDAERAEHHLARYGPDPVTFADPWIQELERLRTGVAAHLFRGGQALAAGDLDGALEELRQAVALDGEDVAARQSLALALARSDPEAAAEQYRQALALAPGDAISHLGLGAVLFRQGRYQEALEPLGRAIELSPTSTDAHLQLADSLFRLRRFADAAEHYGAALEQVPDNALARVYRGVALAESGRLELAEQDLRRALELMPTDGQTHLELARVRVLQAEGLSVAGESAAALAAIEEAHRLVPDDADVAHILARLLATSPEPSLQDGERALALARVAFQRQRSPYYAETLGMALAAAGRFAEAAEWQRAILAEADQSRDPRLVRRLRLNLDRYVRGELAVDPP